MIARRLAWFTTPMGRKVVFAGVFTAGMSFMSINYFPNTFFLDDFREFMQLYRHGLAVPIPEDVLKRFQVVMDDMKVSSNERSLIKPFTVYGFDTFHAGSTYTKQGAIVGIPSFFHYSSVDQVDKTVIKVSGEPVAWSTKEGQQFLDSLILSDAAQKFAIGCEVAYVRTPYVYLNTLYPFAALSLVYTIAQNLNRKLHMEKQPQAIRGVVYSVLAIFGVGLWAVLKDVTSTHYEKKCDEEVSSLSETYAKGGLEFYSKILQRNIALRSLLGKKGKKLYSVSGNRQYFIRQKSLPLINRKLFLENQLAALQKRTEAAEV
ncbi:transmembrane protein 177 isoform X1 [Schistocerca nitens]|uniref:transmembrane protein 177 isoform X1 n=1 Tax=Schistocerca nitens TaxID=7011 RepID=UPI0021190E17|nr:transmembrane protein 177 isoform X1 [Schistocerca nitens]